MISSLILIICLLKILSGVDAFLGIPSTHYSQGSSHLSRQQSSSTKHSSFRMVAYDEVPRRSWLKSVVFAPVASSFILAQRSSAVSGPTEGLEMISYDDFLELLQEREISTAKFYGANGDIVVLTLANGNQVTIGEGMIKESATNPSSPLKVVNKLRDYKVPYSFNFELKKYSKAKAFPNEATKMAEERAKILEAEESAALSK